MKLNENLPEFYYFVKKALENITKAYGGNSDEWIPVDRLIIDEKDEIYPYKANFLKIDANKIIIGRVQFRKSSENYGATRANFDVYPFKNISYIKTYAGKQGIELYFNNSKFLKFLINPFCCEEIGFRGLDAGKIILDKYLEYHDYKLNRTQYSKADEIKKFKELLDDGAITEDEFDKFKKELLD